MDANQTVKNLIKESLRKEIPLQTIRKICIEQNISKEVFDDCLTELAYNDRKTIIRTLAIFSSWNAFKESFSKAQAAASQLRDWNNERKNLINLLLGILIGIDGNIIASGLINGQIDTIFGISLALLLIPVIFYSIILVNHNDAKKEYIDFYNESMKDLADSLREIEQRMKDIEKL